MDHKTTCADPLGYSMCIIIRRTAPSLTKEPREPRYTMNISEIFKHKKVSYSLEIFPPKKDSSYDVIYNTLLRLRGLPADYISVTYGARRQPRPEGKKPSEIASLIRTHYHIEPVAHITCVNSSEQDVIDTLVKKLKENQVMNLMVLRGDISPDIPPKDDFRYASDLAEFIKKREPEFNLVGACYPERALPKPASLDEDVQNLQHKIDNGVTHLVSQLFFDNQAFYRFRDLATARVSSVPIVAGIMPITSQRQIERTVALSGAKVPKKLSRLFAKYANKPKALRDAGIFYAIEQIMDLIDNDIPRYPPLHHEQRRHSLSRQRGDPKRPHGREHAVAFSPFHPPGNGCAWAGGQSSQPS